jgi:hypothetical protein
MQKCSFNHAFTGLWCSRKGKSMLGTKAGHRRQLDRKVLVGHPKLKDTYWYNIEQLEGRMGTWKGGSPRFRQRARRGRKQGVAVVR